MTSNKQGVLVDYRNQYRIPWSRLRTERQLIWWLHHLSEKEWFTTQNCRELIELWAEHYHVPMYEGE